MKLLRTICIIDETSSALPYQFIYYRYKLLPHSRVIFCSSGSSCSAHTAWPTMPLSTLGAATRAFVAAAGRRLLLGGGRGGGLGGVRAGGGGGVGGRGGSGAASSWWLQSLEQTNG